MPRGDGTGPFGNGPLNGGSGRGLGRRRNMNAPGNCPRGVGTGRGSGVGRGLGSGPLLNRETTRAGGLLQGAALKVLGMAAMAIPALLKARKQIEAPNARVLPESQDSASPVIEIEAIPVEEKGRLPDS